MEPASAIAAAPAPADAPAVPAAPADRFPNLFGAPKEGDESASGETIDAGKPTCRLWEALDDLKPKLSAPTQAERDAALFLAFIEPLYQAALLVVHPLSVLLTSFATRTPKLRHHPQRQMQIIAVSRWIHYQEQISTVSPSNETSTRVAVLRILERNGQGLRPDARQRLENQLTLLDTTYNGKPLLSDHPITPSSIQKWHATLYKDIAHDLSGLLPEEIGQWRTGPVEAGGAPPHYYPNNNIVGAAVKNLCGLIAAVSRHIDTTFPDESPRRLACVFSVAALVQFHFVDIHPFVDSNGRMCRFLSKYILDAVCPVPFPMYIDRTRYVKALVDGRQTSNVFHSPLLDRRHQLLHLLFDAAIEHYEHMNKCVEASKFRVFVAADSAALVAVIEKHKDLPKAVINKVMQKFAALHDAGGHDDFEAEGLYCTVIRPSPL